MGNTNACKQLQITPTRTIGTKELDALWAGYAKAGETRLPYGQALKFLSQFAQAVGVPYSKATGKKWLETLDPWNSGYLDYNQFKDLFVKAIKEMEEFNGKRAMLTQTLATKLDLDINLPEEEETKGNEKPKGNDTDDKGPIRLHVATGYSGLLPRKWADTTSWEVRVAPTDTLETVQKEIQKASGEHVDFSKWLLACNSSVRLVSDHTSLPASCSPTTTVSQAGLREGTAIRWWNGMLD